MTYQQKDIADVWDRVSESYSAEAVKQPDYQALIETIVECIGDPSKKTICDVGCGSAATDIILGKLGAAITLVDISAKAIEFARKRFEEEGLTADYHNCDATKEMILPNGKFDVVWNGGVIEHFNDEGKIALIKEMWNITKPGGIILILLPNQWCIPFVIGKWIATVRHTWKYGFEDDLTAKRLKNLAHKAGLIKVDLFTFNPIVGMWWLPCGKLLTNALNLNTVGWHKKRWPFGNVLCLKAEKPS
jgi:2-polyprenyl-3-methyl-5-hydroxy-6-metoxy-1,4-benzoquinol methylase